MNIEAMKQAYKALERWKNICPQCWNASDESTLSALSAAIAETIVRRLADERAGMAHFDPLWADRKQKFLDAVRVPLNGQTDLLTAGWVLETIHDKTGAVTPEAQSVIRDILSLVPGFQPESSATGMYHFGFFRQLEFLSEGTRRAVSARFIE